MIITGVPQGLAFNWKKIRKNIQVEKWEGIKSLRTFIFGKNPHNQEGIENPCLNPKDPQR